MEYVPLDIFALYYISRLGSHVNWELVQDDPFIVKDTKHDRYYEISMSGHKTEVFPTEINKVVYLPKELC